MKTIIQLSVNGEPIEAAVEPNRTLLQLLRDDLGLTGTKHGCGLGDCGACTVILDGMPVNSCLVLAVQAAGREVSDHRRAGRKRKTAPDSAGVR